MVHSSRGLLLLLAFAIGSLNACGSSAGNEGESGGTTGDSQASFCLAQCSLDADCLFNGQDFGFVCDNNHCSVPTCTSDEACVAELSMWTSGAPCTPGGGECISSMKVCIDVDGEGHCAYTPNSVDCASLGMVAVTTPNIDGNDVTVCGQPNAMCKPGGYCHSPCTNDDSCSAASHPHCDVASGECQCTSDADCQAGSDYLPQATTCIDGHCGCGSDQDCIDAQTGDLCIDGDCHCSGDQACSGFPNPLDGTVIVCGEW